MRLFVAIPLPEPVRTRLAALQAGVPEARWVDADDLHLTLRYVGEVDGAQAEELHEALAEVAAPPLALTLAGVGQFGSGGHGRQWPRALWAGVDRSAALAALRDKVERACVTAGLEPEHRKFMPHVTLARLNRAAPLDRVIAFLSQHALLREAAIPVEAFGLYESLLTDDGPLYTELARYELG